MARTQIIDSRKVQSGDDLLLNLFGQPGDKHFSDVAVRDQRQVLGADVQSNEYRLPESMDVIVNAKLRRNYTGDKSDLISLKMNLGTKALFSHDRISQDLIPPILWIHGQLAISSPRGATGRYSREHVFTVNGDLVGPSPLFPRGDSVFRVGVTNRIDYATTLENPGWPRTYQKVLLKAQRRYGREFDIRLSYVQGDEIGGTITTSGKTKRYTQPHIEIGALGSFGGRTGFTYGKRQRRNKRRNRSKK